MGVKIDKLIKSKRRTFCLEITDEACLVVRAPFFATREQIKDIVNQRSKWITKTRKFVEECYLKCQPKKFVEGECFLYLGEQYSLRYSDHTLPPLIFYNNFILARRYAGNAREVFMEFYKNKAQEKIAERVKYYEKKVGVELKKQIRITKAMKRWGSCSANDELNFSWRLIMAPLRVIDYVVVHELTHIKEKNHSCRFWSKINAVFPDYREQKMWLIKNTNLLKL